MTEQFISIPSPLGGGKHVVLGRDREVEATLPEEEGRAYAEALNRWAQAKPRPEHPRYVVPPAQSGSIEGIIDAIYEPEQRLDALEADLRARIQRGDIGIRVGRKMAA